MVAVPPGYWIDATEVTKAQYAAWLSTEPSIAAQQQFCSFNTTFIPGCDWPPTGDSSHPVVGVDWCDANAYCKGVGKRLCGRIGGGSTDYNAYADATTSQWYHACTAGGQNDYPYGDTYQPHTCNGNEDQHTGCDGGVCSSSAVASLSGCQSSIPEYAGVFDMSGNVYEWEDACEASNGATDACHVRGGSFFGDGPMALRCDSGLIAQRNSDWSHICGFRCCR